MSMKIVTLGVFLFSVVRVYGQVGIGTTSSLNALDIMGSSQTPASTGNAANGVLRIQKSSSNPALDLGVNAAVYTWLQARSAADYSSNQPLLLNPAGGKVSIGGAEGSAALTVNGNVSVSGTVKAAQAGQVLNNVILNESDLSKSNNSQISSGRSTLLSYNYTPVSSSSKILVSFHGKASINGTASDEWYSYLVVGSTTIQTRRAKFENSSGGGGRGTSLLPLSGVYTNSGTSALTIKFDVQFISGDDTFTLQPDMILSITEVAR